MLVEIARERCKQNKRAKQGLAPLEKRSEIVGFYVALISFFVQY